MGDTIFMMNEKLNDPLAEVMAESVQDTLSAKQARRLLRTSRKPIFGWVNLHADDGAYVQIQKGSILASINPTSEARYLIKEREDGVYVN